METLDNPTNLALNNTCLKYSNDLNMKKFRGVFFCKKWGDVWNKRNVEIINF